MSEDVKLIEKPSSNLRSEWGHYDITLSPVDLIKIKKGETLYINIMDEYSVFVSIGKETRCDVAV